VNGGLVAVVFIGSAIFVAVFKKVYLSDVYPTPNWNFPRLLTLITFVYFVLSLFVTVMFCFLNSGIKNTSGAPLEINPTQLNLNVM
jgi:hypothetical protein